MRVKEYKEMMKTMTEHEEYKNADVPKEIWIQRNEYLHKHIDNLYEEIKELRTDNIRLTKQLEEQLQEFRNKGQI
jgi:predicted  nucleic acid-binding Zn-ribbon protein|tara:strand:- start:796 stop:1020 length:225 start_codon:yes stop_codon:yes gene_type:complete